MIEIGVVFTYVLIFTTFQVFLIGENSKHIYLYGKGLLVSLIGVVPIFAMKWVALDGHSVFVVADFWDIVMKTLCMVAVVSGIQWYLHTKKKGYFLLGVLGGMGTYLMHQIYFMELIYLDSYEKFIILKLGLIIFIASCGIQVLLYFKNVPSILSWILPSQLIFISMSVLSISSTFAWSALQSDFINGKIIYIWLFLKKFIFLWLPGTIIIVYGLYRVKTRKEKIQLDSMESEGFNWKKIGVATGMLAVLLGIYWGNSIVFVTDGDFEIENYHLVAYHGDGGKISIPKGVTHIKNGVFDGKNITAVSFPDTVFYIGEGAFQNNQITKLTIPDTVQFIEKNAFRENDLTEVKLPETLLYIGDSAFSGNLLGDETDLELPMFSYTTEKAGFVEKEISVNNAEKSLGDTEILNEDFIVRDKSILIEYIGDAHRVNIPDGITEIGEGAFAEMQLDYVYLPESVTTIGEKAFELTGMQEIKFSEGLLTIEENAFSGTDLTDIVLPNSLLDIEAYAFSYTELESVTYGNQLQKIGSHAFANGELQSVSLPESVEKIEDYAFLGNPIVDVKFADTDIDVSGDAFKETPWYEHATEEFVIVGAGTLIRYNGTDRSIKIPEGVMRIGADVFLDKGLTEIILPETLQHIGMFAFYNNDIQNVVFPIELQSIGNGAFGGNQIKKVILPDSIKSVGKMAFVDNQIEVLELSSFLKRIEDETFSGNSIETLSLSDTIESIGAKAFFENEIQEVRWSSSLKEIGRDAFCGNEINELMLPDSLESIGIRGFAQNHINQLELPVGLKELDFEAFAENEIKHLELPNGIVTVGDRAFANNDVETFDLPENVAYWGRNVFLENPWEAKLDSEFIIIGDGVLYQYMGSQAHVAVPDGVKEIGSFAFADLEMISSIYLPDSVEIIRQYAFLDSSLKTILLPETIKKVECGAFEGTNLSYLTVPYTIDEIHTGVLHDMVNTGILIVQYTEEDERIKNEFMKSIVDVDSATMYYEKIDENI